MSVIKEIQKICNGLEYTKGVPQEAVNLAIENNCIIVLGASDDTMQCYGASCYLTKNRWNEYGFDGSTLKGIKNKKIEKEAEQIGLMIWWCGRIASEGISIENYNVCQTGAFYYSVKEGIEALDFRVFDYHELYCTGKVIQLPDGFKSAI